MILAAGLYVMRLCFATTKQTHEVSEFYSFLYFLQD